MERMQATWACRLTERLWWSKESEIFLVRFLEMRRAHQERNAEEKEVTKKRQRVKESRKKLSLRKVGVDTFCKEIVRFRGC